MKKRYISILSALAILVSPPVAWSAQVATVMSAQPESETDDEEEIDGEETATDDEDDRAVRENPVIIPDEADDIDIPIPSFIRKGANHIIYNGSDWSDLRKAFVGSGNRPVSIIHIGDSHIQADISSGTTRELLQYDFGNAGRGLIAPLKMSGTNQPVDYLFQSKNAWNPVKLMSASWRQTVGFTGTSIHPVSNSSEITVGTTERDDYNPFSSVTIFHNGKMTIENVTDSNGNKINFRAIPSRDYTQIVMASTETKVSIQFKSTGDLTIFGASLSGSPRGVFYHAIGNNGATYDTYNRIGTVGQGISPLNPDLVIISLGTNEAFGRLDVSGFTRAIDRLVKNIRASNPDAQILLTTPMECQKSVYSTKKTRVKTKRRRGKKSRYRTVSKKVKSYAVNNNIAPLRQAILDYGKNNSIAVYDWYEVAGGRGASSTWISHNLFAGDRVHHTHKGYNLEGRLVYDAIMDALRDNK